MAKFKASRFYQVIVLVMICAASALVGFALRNNGENGAKASLPLSAQRSDEKVIELKDFPNEPYEYSDLGVKKTKLASGQKFNAVAISEKNGGSAENWLENLEFSFKNKLEKKITYLRFEVDFPETRVGGPMMVYQIIFGVLPNAPENVKRFRQPFTLDSGDKYHYVLSQRDLENIKKFLSNGTFQLENMNQVDIRVGEIFYEDGTRWWQGYWYKPNPNQPGGYEKIN